MLNQMRYNIRQFRLWTYLRCEVRNIALRLRLTKNVMVE